MPSVEMRRSTRVFVPKAKDGELVRVLRSGRRLWVESTDVKTNNKVSPRNGDVWFPLLKQHKEVNGWHGLSTPVHDLPVQDPMDVDEAKRAVFDVGGGVPVCRNDRRLFMNVYSRKRKRGNGGGGDGRKFGLHFVRKKRRTGVVFNGGGEVEGCVVDGVLCVYVDASCVGCSLFTNVLGSLLRSFSVRRVGLAELSGFLVSNPICPVFASAGVHFLWNCRSFESKGVCRIFGVRGMAAMFAVDYMAAPQCFQHLYFALLIRSVRLSCLLFDSPGEDESDDIDEYLICINDHSVSSKKNENDGTDEPFQCINDPSVSSRKNENDGTDEPLSCINDESVNYMNIGVSYAPRSRYMNDQIEMSPGIVLALGVVDANHVKPVKKPSVKKPSVKTPPVKTPSVAAKTCTRNVPSRVGVLTRSTSKRRRRSLRSRRARDPLHLVLQKFSGPPVSNHVSLKKSSVTNHDSPNKHVSSLPLATKQELGRSVRKVSENQIRVQTPSSSVLTVDTDSQCCSANVLVVESDKCYRVEGAEVMVEVSASGEWLLVVKKDNSVRYSFKVQREMKMGATNRVTHASIWTSESGCKLEFPERKEWVVFKELYKMCAERNIVPMSPVVRIIPVPEVCEVTNLLDSPGAYKRPESYIRTTSDELSRALSRRTANYDMDSEDEEWLSKFNSELDALKYVSDESFELMIDAFEKASYCSSEDIHDEKAAASLCLDMASGEVAEPIYRYWVEKRKHKSVPLIRVFQLNQPTRAPLLTKPVLRKKRSLKRPSALSIQRGRGKDINVLQEMTAEQSAAEEHSAILRVQEAKASAEKSVELAVLKRKRAQLLMENADLAMYRATMALRIADAAVEILDPEQAANHFLD